ncbi:MAG TPA: hypothetical protein PK668_01945 [Myxococcota bacterium]|nr:hypothetical protein [Myxococcota bacterium]HRY94670.1 hypothetical protein [Myxococcota bacterium]
MTGDRWVEPFLDANRSTLARLSLRPEVRVDPRPSVLLHPGPKVGAIPLLNPSTRRVAAGLLVEPRFRWVALGSVFNAIGFSVEPSLGGGALVPGSAREVPPWILAGPVLQRLAALLNHRRRGFIERSESRASPRGRVDWTRWASLDVPHGRWTTFPCTFSDPDDDPSLMAAVRWTLARIGDELAAIPWSLPARTLLERTAELQVLAGTGVALRPSPFWSPLAESDWVLSAVEAMGWVAEERGLGGSRTLDGLAWDLSIDEVWEAWVAAFAADLARQLGMTASTFKSVRRPLRWSGPVRSMGSLAPDIELRNPERVIWIDAKYKAHLELLGRHGWEGLKEEVREQHRADLHQALAYASLADAPLVDTVLIYPQIGDQTQRTTTIASVTSGRRRVRIFLASLPFGYRHPEHRTACLSSFSELYSA